jgi:hypothetical protein
MLLDHFRLLPFIIGLAVGCLVVFYYKPPPLIVHEYPHPENVDQRVYRDQNGICYRYQSKEADCDKNEENLKVYPLQA